MNKKQQIFYSLWFRFRLKYPFYFPRSKSIAEFGIGKGGFGDFYASKFGRVYGIDIEDYSAHYNNVDFILSDGKTCGLADNAVDMVASHSVLEHVRDINQSLSEINRITKIGGLLYLTVEPLYYSSYGSHIVLDGSKLENWEHLDRTKSYYLTDNPMPDSRTSGHYLNKLTSNEFISAVSRLPWRIVKYTTLLEKKPIPEFVNRDEFPESDLLTKGFRFIGQKMA